MLQALASHATALRVYELSDVMPAKIHLGVPKDFRKRAPKGVMLHKSELTQGDIAFRDGYRITTPLRALLDVANSPLSPEHLASALQEALERGLVRRAKVDEALSMPPNDMRDRVTYLGLP